MRLPRQFPVFSVAVLVLISAPLIPSHKYKGKKVSDHRGISVYEVPHNPYPPPIPAYPSTFYPTSFGPPQYDAHAIGPSYYPPSHPPPGYGVSYVPVCVRNCDDEGNEGKKSNKGLIKSLKKEEFKLYKELKKMTIDLWKSHKKGKESEVVTVHRPIYHPPPPPRLVEVRVPRCKDTIEVPTYVTETLIKTNKIYVTKTRTRTTERHIKEYVVNTEYRTKTATQVVSHYAAPEVKTVYSPPETVTVYSPPETIIKTNHVTHHHPTTKYVPHYVTVTVSAEPSYQVQHDFSEHATPFHATEHFPPSSYDERIPYAKRQAGNHVQQTPQLPAVGGQPVVREIEKKQQTTSQ